MVMFFVCMVVCCNEVFVRIKYIKYFNFLNVIIYLSNRIEFIVCLVFSYFISCSFVMIGKEIFRNNRYNCKL